MTVKLPLDILPIVSIALQFTVVVVIGKVAPDAGIQVTIGLSGSVSVEVAEKVIAFPHDAVASAVIFAGRLSTGAVVSIVNEVTASTLLALVAASVTVIVQVEYVPSARVMKVIVFRPTVAEVVTLEHHPA